MEFFGPNKIMNNFRGYQGQPNEKETLHMAHQMIDKNMKLDKYVEEQKENGYKDYDMDY